MLIKSVSEQIKNQALKIGFSACGITDAEPLFNEKEHLENWIKFGYNGTMKYMENNFDKRLNPKLLVENTKSIIVVLLNYKPQITIPQEQPQIAKYAYGIDYHFVVKQKLYQLLKYINTEITVCNGVAFVDSAPVLERSLAVKAGLGWIGKNSLLINKTYGSMTFIGELFVDIPLYCDTEIEENQCGECQNCIKNCPTEAIKAPKTIDANRCISYLTIEHKGEIPAELKSRFGNRIFGCDDCIDACPFNKNTPFCTISELQPLKEIFNIDWQNISKSNFKRIFKKSAIRRAKMI